ncbi:MAG TPA: TIR domain-containing protein [Anaerolineales bacterium]|nr:TIR domain-containing protein [Anaerolineales bacterium]
MIEGRPPKVFISYSWDDDKHQEWVRDFAIQLRRDGIDVVLDRWNVAPGDQLPRFMERAVTESDFVLCVCTPRYKEKSDLRGGGVGYEDDIITAEIFANQNQRKFIPVLRRGEWKETAPSWLLGKYYVDLCNDPYSERNYRDLLTALLGEREPAPPIGNNQILIGDAGVELAGDKDDFEFVNRKIELATLDPAGLEDTYWQCALVSAPTGYGKSHLLKRLVDNIQNSEQLRQKWNCCYIDLNGCKDPVSAIRYIGEKISGKVFLSDYDDETIRIDLRNYILDNMSMPLKKGVPRGILLIIDHIDNLPLSNMVWLSSLLHDVITGSYISYKNDHVSFTVRVILAGIDIEIFWKRYKDWEKSSGCDHFLKSPERLSLSAFKKIYVEELISRRAKKNAIPVEEDDVSDIADKLLYLSGGHPAIINGILNELISIRFRLYDGYLRSNRERLVKNHVSPVVKKVLSHYPLRQAQHDIKTICVFRLIQLGVLQLLRSEKLIFPSVEDNVKFLGSLSNKIFNLDKKMPFYRDDIIRRILYLDFAFGSNEFSDQIQTVHRCAMDYYYQKLSGKESEQLGSYFVEWLFHVLQITDFPTKKIVEEWKVLLSGIRSTSVIPEDLKQVILDELETDSEVKYLYRERFGLEDFSPLFEF